MKFGKKKFHILHNARYRLAAYVFLVILTFIPLSLFGFTDIDTDSVQGQWDHSGSPYYIHRNVWIPSDGILSIEADVEFGVEIIMTGDFQFNVLGELNAIGGENANQKIQFRRADSLRWKGILFQPGSRRSILNYCEIFNTFKGVECRSSSPRILNCDIQSQYAGIVCDASSPLIENNLIHVEGSTTQENTGILITLGSNPTVYDNTIFVEGLFNAQIA